MTIKANIKQIGSKRKKLNTIDFYLEKEPVSVRELIIYAVTTCVYEYNSRVKSGENAVKPVTDEQIGYMSEIGKIAFGINYGDKEADLQEAINNALQSYRDGLFRVFINDSDAGEIDNQISLIENDTVTFIRLAMLAGRMW